MAGSFHQTKEEGKEMSMRPVRKQMEVWIDRISTGTEELSWANTVIRTLKDQINKSKTIQIRLRHYLGLQLRLNYGAARRTKNRYDTGTRIGTNKAN